MNQILAEYIFVKILILYKILYCVQTISAAVRGELGPLTQAIAKYQIQQAIKNEVEKYRIMQEKLKKVETKEKKKPENQHVSRTINNSICLTFYFIQWRFDI